MSEQNTHRPTDTENKLMAAEEEEVGGWEKIK